jgi:hypothetical protein
VEEQEQGTFLTFKSTSQNNNGEGCIIVPVHKKGDKTDCSNYCEISLLSASYKIVSNILLSRLSPYVDEIIGCHQCGV